MVHAEKIKLVGDIERAAEVIVADHDMQNEYLTDAERAWIIAALREAIARER